jgi:hypothetical protein
MKNLSEITIKNVIKKVLNEQVLDNTRKNTVISAYNQIVSAVSGWGTNPDKVLLAIGTLKNVNEFRYLLTLFKDKKTGYGDFVTMINEEYDRFNFNDIVKLTNKLRLMGVKTKFNEGVNNFGTKLFFGNFKITYIPTLEDHKLLNNANYIKVNNACKTKWQNQFPKAVSFWVNWLNDPITRKKVEKNWRDESNFLSIYSGYLSVRSSIAWSKYKDALSSLKLVFYDHTMDYVGNVKTSDNALAFVSPGRYNIYVNCSNNDPDPYGTLIHEIQHIIYDIKPLNPAKKISDVFVTKNTVKQTEQKIKSSLPNDKTKTYSSEVVNASKKTGIKVENIQYWKDQFKWGSKRDDPGYLCRETEKMSNIMSIRKTLNIGPGGNITYSMLKPYINREKNNTDIYWFLLCWAQNGFPDINQMLNKVNQLAYNNTKNNVNNNTNVA